MGTVRAKRGTHTLSFHLNDKMWGSSKFYDNIVTPCAECEGLLQSVKRTYALPIRRYILIHTCIYVPNYELCL